MLQHFAYCILKKKIIFYSLNAYSLFNFLYKVLANKCVGTTWKCMWLGLI